MAEKSDATNKDFSIVLCGQAGQGVQTVENILVHVLKLCGYHVYATKEYMSRVRGGMNSTEIRVSSSEVAAYVDRMDILIPFHPEAFAHLEKRLRPETIVIGDRKNICRDCPPEVKHFIDVPLEDIAKEIGGRIYINTLSAAVVLGLFRAPRDVAGGFIKKVFLRKGEDIVQKNLQAIERGCDIGEKLLESEGIDLALSSHPDVEKEILLNGAEAVGLGALAGGCNFLSSYPMSPSTGVMVFLAQHAGEFGLVVEQAEDEISAINMALGASYAGARAMVTTSGGGFALMIEGVSLAGMIETPVVIHVAQRPGPATGLPTRTEQGDLEMVLYSGHGEFPRVLYAPGKLEDAVYLTQRAFNIADKYQIPVFILTDQYLMDSYYNIYLPDLKELKIEKHIVETAADYKRFALTEDGLSPRGIPGYGSGLVGVDSDEHDAEAHITEDLDLRTKMVEKRLAKMNLVERDVIPPELVGPEDYRILLIGWGSTYKPVTEALGLLSREDLSFLHFTQVYPLPAGTLEFLEKAEKLIIIENNATSQFSRLIKLNTGLDIEDKLLKYSGLPFSVEDIVDRIREILR